MDQIAYIVGYFCLGYTITSLMFAVCIRHSLTPRKKFRRKQKPYNRDGMIH
jgi:hypothetical protein